MLRKLGLFLFCIVDILVYADDRTLGEKTRTELSVWLIPIIMPLNETKSATDPSQLESEILDFNTRFGNNCGLTVENTTRPLLRDQLMSRNPEFGEPDWPTVKAHEQSLKCLRRFAVANDVHLNVRFLMWGRAFEYLQTISQFNPKRAWRSIAATKFYIYNFRFQIYYMLKF